MLHNSQVIGKVLVRLQFVMDYRRIDQCDQTAVIIMCQT